MATRLYGANVGFHLEDVTEGVGSATTSHSIELTVDLATNLVTEGSSTRQILKNEVLIALNLFEQYIIKGKWPPA